MNIIDLNYIKQGSTFSQKIVSLPDGSLTTGNLTGATATIKFRTNYSDPYPLLSLSSPASGITLTPSDPSFTISLTAAQTLSLPAGPGFYDMFLTLSGGSILALMEGVFRVFPTADR